MATNNDISVNSRVKIRKSGHILHGFEVQVVAIEGGQVLIQTPSGGKIWFNLAEVSN